MEIPAALRTLIESAPLAHVVTLNHDGSPQVTVVWIAMIGDNIVSAHMHLNQKLRNVAADPRVSISLEAPPTPGAFLAEYAVVYGSARVVAGGAGLLLQQLGKKYVGPDFEFPVGDDPAGGYLLQTTIERIGGVGPWVTPAG